MGETRARARTEQVVSQVISGAGPADPPTVPFAAARRGALFGTLRRRLIASHVLVLLLALALVLGISAIGLRRYERGAQVDELSDLAVPLVVEARLLLAGTGEQDGATRQRIQELLSYQAAEMDVRILVLRRDGSVIFDSARTGSLAGQTLVGYQMTIERLVEATQGRQRVQRTMVLPSARSDDPFAGQIVVLAAGGRAVAGQPLPRTGGALMVVAPPRRQGLTGRFLPPLLAILALALAVAAAAGYLLSRRIAAPVSRLTVAADRMAAGDLEQRVPAAGPDEIGRLVASFNAMSDRVAATDRSQRKLLADIAHELRTPLTSVQGYTQALRDDVLSSEAERQRALATIGSEADRMGRLIRQVLDLARLESGQVMLRPRPIALRPFLERIQQRFGPEVERSGVAMIVAAAPETVALADEERLNQIVDNLVGNALRYTPAGGEVVLGAAADEAIGRVRLTVRDTGQGIEPERLPRIFERFERGDDAADRQGFGLGLSIVRELVQRHGGTVSVDSQVGAGTTFTVELPAMPNGERHPAR